MFNELKIKSQIEELRQKWVKAKLANDTKLMSLWEKLGKKLKEQLETPDNFNLAKKIFLENKSDEI
jgi:hypothetical protein